VGDALTNVVRWPARAVLFDFYGTLGESDWEEWWMEVVFGRRGYAIPREPDRRWSIDRYDGHEHLEHSQSETHYSAWLREQWEGLARDCGVPPEEVEEVLEELAAQRNQFRMRLYPEALDVVRTLKDRGFRVGVCSNWDWDLDRHLDQVGLSGMVDGRVSSAWVGARKPHRRVFDAALAAVEVDAEDAVFVGDNWRADVEGARAIGLRVVHAWRHDDHPGDWLPVPPEPPDDVPRVRDLRELLDLLELAPT
jgi:putative hydrolase of the HAD superfamily